MTVEQIIKQMMIWEIYRLNDVAIDAAVYFREILASKIDVDRAIEHLVRSAGLPRPEAKEAPATEVTQAPDPRRSSVRRALREGASDVGASLLHSIRYRLGRVPRGPLE
jgi:hypothetical protein